MGRDHNIQVGVAMGRKRRRQTEEVEVEMESPSRKRSKKDKHKKKKTKRDCLTEKEPDAPVVKPLTLKIRLGKEVMTAEGSDIASLEDDSNNAADVSSNSIKSGSAAGLIKQNSEEWGGSDDILSVGEDSYQNTLPDDVHDEIDEGGVNDEEGLGEDQEEDDDEEEVWLDALESGNVDERGYVPQKKDLTAMTARQRAIFGSKEVELLELPLSRKRVDVDEEETQEMLLKKTERNKKRRLQAIKRREKHKAETVKKLLQKQSRKKEDKKFEKSVVGPHLRYVNGYNGVTISLTKGLDYPLPHSSIKPFHIHLIPCTVCSSPKKYNDSVTKLPLCSLECYNKLKKKVLSTS